MTDTSFRLPLALIVVDPSKNCRREVGSIDDLVGAESFYHPLLVRPRDDGRFDLVTGYRRHAAAVQKGWTEIECKLWEGDELNRAITNVRENLDRRSLTSWETAYACQRLHTEHKLSGDQIAARTGLHRSTVFNHLRCLRVLETSIQRAWERSHPAANVDFLRELAALPHDQQLERWLERTGGAPPRPPIARPAAAPPPSPGRRPSKKQLEIASKHLEQTEESPDWRRGAAAALDFVLGRASELGTYRLRRHRKPRAARGKGNRNASDPSRAPGGPVGAALAV